MKKLSAFALLLCLSNGVYAIDAKQCVKGFKLTGKVDEQFTKINQNAWNKILPKMWIDKGGHFLHRIKEADRGGAAAIYTPSELQSFVMGGELQPDPLNTIRFYIVQVRTKIYKLVFDVNNKNKKCELVTFLISTS